jgi:hypothetical protein
LEIDWSGKHILQKSFPVVGEAKVYMRRNENMGKCLLKNGFITPNMPKLGYAVDFRYDGETVIMMNRLTSEAEKFDYAHVFEKRDGFNCLFYLYRNRVIPKTRLAPIASGKIIQIIKLSEFPMKNVEEMVKDDYIPVFEIWGTKLLEYNIQFGCVDVKKVQELEGLPELNVDLIAVMQADYKNYNYTFLPPDQIFKLARDYNLNPVKYHGTIELTYNNVTKIMEEVEEQNKDGIISEGRVLHCYNGQYKMFKVKPFDIMTKDVSATSKIISPNRIVAELQKILLETDVLEITRNPDCYIKQLIDYLSEDYKLNKKSKKFIMKIFVQEIAREFVQRYKDVKEPWKLGVHKMFLGQIMALLR